MSDNRNYDDIYQKLYFLSLHGPVTIFTVSGQVCRCEVSYSGCPGVPMPSVIGLDLGFCLDYYISGFCRFYEDIFSKMGLSIVPGRVEFVGGTYPFVFNYRTDNKIGHFYFLDVHELIQQLDLYEKEGKF